MWRWELGGGKGGVRILKTVAERVPASAGTTNITLSLRFSHQMLLT